MRFRGLTAVARAAVGALTLAGAFTGVGLAAQQAPAGAAGGASISGTVRDTAGAPLAGVCVEAQDAQWHYASAQTAANGTYRIDLPTPGSYVVRFGCYNGPWVVVYWPSAIQRAAATPVEAAEGQSVTGIDAALAQGGVVTGRVTDGSGAPIVNAYVNISAGYPGYYGTTAADGTYRIQGVAPGSYVVYGYGQSGQFFWHGTDFTNTEHLVVAAGRTSSGIDMTSAAAAEIRGRVTDEGGAPLAGRCVVAETLTEPWPYQVGYGTTAEDGTYAMGFLPAGTYRVLFNTCGSEGAGEFYDNASSRSAATPLMLSSGQVATGIDAAIAPGSGITGVVTNPAGQPVAGACVSAARSDDSGFNYRSTSTDAAGAYRVGALSPGQYRLYVSPCQTGSDLLPQLYGAPPGDPRDASAQPIAVAATADTTGIDVQLVRGGVIEGTVTSGGQPVAGMCVLASSHDGSTYASGSAQADGAGHYSLKPLPAGNIDVAFFTCGPQFQDLVPEWYHDAPVQSQATPVAVSLGQTTSGIDEDLAAGATVSGTVSAAAGGPARGTCALARRTDVPPPPPEGEALSTYHYGFVDNAGHYTMRGVGTGSYTVRFADCGGNNRYIPAYYDGTADEASATPLNVTAGQAVTGIDAVLSLRAPVVQSVRPGGGSAGDVVSVVGLRVGPDTQVRFGGTLSPQLTRVTDEQVDAVVPAGAAGSTVDVTVTGAGGTSPVVAADQFTYDGRPVVTSVSPAKGGTAGGATVTVKGARFTGATAVRFGAHDAADFTVVDDATITAQVPAADVPGAVVVAVTTPAGANDEGAVYAYDDTPPPPPQISGLTPNQGPPEGGNEVLISGANLTGATAVHFGANEAQFTVLSDTAISAVAPPGGVWSWVGVDVTTPSGTSGSWGYSYRPPPPPPPTLSSVSPDHGPLAGGDSVTLTGSGFYDVYSVRFGANYSPSVGIYDEHTMVATVPAGAAPGTVAVVLEGAGGTSNALDYTYDVPPPPPPSVDAVAPDHGPQAGGNTVTITGSHLTGATSVRFGAHDSPSFAVVDDATVTAEVPPGDNPGPVAVTVTTPAGSRSGSAYTYDAPPPPVPVVTALSPDHGPEAGGTAVTLTGSGLTGATSVRFGSVEAAFQVVDDATISATSPAGAAGPVDVTVATPGGTSAAQVFTYDAPPPPPPAPAVYVVAPNVGATEGGDQIQLGGEHLAGATSVRFGDREAAFTVTGDALITATTPAADGPGSVTVSVTTPGGTWTSSGPVFRYIDRPVITGVTPAEGPTAGGTIVTVSGSSFSDVYSLRFGERVVDFTRIDDNTIVTASPEAYEGGLVHITVDSLAGRSAATDADRFEYRNLPHVLSLAPSSGPAAGGTAVTLTGQDFRGATSVRFGSAEAVFTVIDDATISATAPAGAGSQVVTVTTVGGTSQDSAVFSYIAAPVVTGVNSPRGPVAGGQTVTITGEHLTGAWSVSFGDIGVGNFTVVDDNTITLVTPEHPSATVSVSVSTPGGTTTKADAYRYVGNPVITGVSPSSGPILGGTKVTISGQDFVDVTGVYYWDRLGNAYISGVVVNPDGTISVTMPPHLPETVTLFVQTVWGKSSPNDPAGFTYKLL